MKVTLELKKRGNTVTVSSIPHPVVESVVERVRDAFLRGYVDYCWTVCDVDEDLSDAVAQALSGQRTEAEVLPWWTAMTVRVIAGARSSDNLNVRLGQREDIYLCYAYRLGSNGERVLATPPVPAYARDRMREVGTISNYWAYILMRYPDGFSSDVVTTFLREHDIDFTMCVERTEEGECTKLTLTPNNEEIPDSAEGVYSYRRQMLSLPNPKPGQDDVKILVRSQSVREVLPELGAAWARMKACRLLLLAPSGSGKDVLKDFFCAGVHPMWSETGGRTIELSLAGLSPEETIQAIRGREWHPPE